MKKPKPSNKKNIRTTEQERHRLMRWARTAAGRTNLLGNEKRRGPKPKPVTLPSSDTLHQILEGDDG